MSSTRDIILDHFRAGDTDRLRFTVRKNGAAWLNIDSVEVVFEKPDRETQFSRPCVFEAGEVWYYDLTETDLDPDDAGTIGWWTLSIYVIDGAARKRYPYEISFFVDEQP